MPTRKQRMALPRHGFSLTEVLVAMTVLGLLCVLLFSIVGNATRLWREQEAREEGIREARAALNFISRDLENALFPPDMPSNWFYTDTNRLAFVTVLPASAQSPGNRGDVCIVGYSLEWGKADAGDAGEPERQSLYRYVRFSDATHDTLMLGSGAVEGVFQTPDNLHTFRELLARNVSKLAWELYRTDESGQPVAFTAIAGRPDLLEVRISVLNERTAARLSAPEQWTDTNSLLVRQNEQSFALRVRPKQP